MDLSETRARLSGQMLERATALMQNAPGRVEVARVNDIGQVRLLRQCREALTDDERSVVDEVVAEVGQALVGAEVAAAPKPNKRPKWRILGGISFSLATKEARDAEEWHNKVRAAGGPAKLPAPAGLTAAAEAWAVATLSADRVEDSVGDLLRPWENAEVTSL